MISSSRPLSRRTVLRGAFGACLSLPLLEAMLGSRARAATPAASPMRLLFCYVPMGVDLDAWTPKTDGSDYELPPTLEPLKNVRDQVLVLSGLQLRREDEAGNPHPRASSTFLSTAPIGKLDNAGFCTSTSIDQLAAKKLGQETRLPSLELGCQRGLGKHSSNISWSAAGSPMGQEVNPRQVFLRLFGDPKGDVCRRSVLDLVMEDAKALGKDLTVADRAKVDEYLTSVRSIEKEIQATERDRELRGAPDMPMPEAIPAGFPEHLRIMSELMVVAMQADATRVGSMMYAVENGGSAGASYRHLGINEDHHGLTHFTEGTREKCLEKLAKIDRFHIETLAYTLERMKGIKDGDKTLLDNVAVLYGSGLSWGNRHNTDNIPILLCGGAGGSLKSGQHITYPKGTPLANLHLSLLNRAGIKLDRVADSTDRLGGLT
jgi:hypothetical protein